jgi:hypothetical protein
MQTLSLACVGILYETLSGRRRLPAWQLGLYYMRLVVATGTWLAPAAARRLWRLCCCADVIRSVHQKGGRHVGSLQTSTDNATAVSQ